jgi:hypothetical protein
LKKNTHRPLLVLAIGLSVTLHLLLFMAVRPASGSGLSGRPVPPKTHYLAAALPAERGGTEDIRTLWSPVLFSLPSEMGFSRDLLQEKLSTRLTFRQPDDTERFLALDTAPHYSSMLLHPEELLMTAGGQPFPEPPARELPSGTGLSAPRRIYIGPALKERLVGGIVLPPELNRPAETAWEIRADISISGEGDVRHVFLEQPHESPELNGYVIQMLHGLRFKSGRGAAEGSIEIYSAAASSGGEVEP